MRTVVRLKMRLRNQRMLTRISVGVGANLGVVGMSVPFTRPSSWARMRDKSISDGSCFKDLYDSIMNAVTTAEKRPAFK